MRQIILFALISYCLAAFAVGQSVVLSKDILQQRTDGDGGQDEFKSLVSNWRGDIAAVGNAARGNHGNQDISFTVFDARLNKIVGRHIGRQADDGAGQVAALPDGRYLVAGFSTQPGGRFKTKVKYFGKRDGWLLLLDERGETEREIILGTAEDDMFAGLAVCPDGSVWVAGNSGQHAWLLRFDPELNLIWERRIQYHGLKTQAIAAALMPDGAFYTVGDVEELGKKQLWMMGLDHKGQFIMEKTFPGSQAESGTGITAVEARSIAISGIFDDPRDRENGFISGLDGNGAIQKYQKLGGREYDRLFSLIRLHNGNLLAGGASSSFERGSRRISAWIALTDADGNTLQEQYYGSKLNDEALALLEHSDGRLFAAGVTARHVLKMRQSWIFQISEPSKTRAPKGAFQASIGSLTYPYSNGLAIYKRAVVAFSLKNTEKNGYCNVRALIKPTDPATAELLRIPASQTVLLPPLAAGRQLNWGLPIRFASAGPPGSYRFQVQFFQADTPIGDVHFFDLHLGKPAYPQLNITAVPLDSNLSIGRQNFIKINIQNTGMQEARDLSLSAAAPEGIKLPATALLGDLAPGAHIAYTLPILLERNTMPGQTARLSLRVADGNLLHAAATEVNLKLIPPEVRYETASTAPDYTVAIWLYPNPDNFDRRPLVWPQEEITVQVKVVSGRPIARSQFCIEINGQPCSSGAKFEEVQMKGDQKSKTFSQTLRLTEGENLLCAKIKDANGDVKSETLKVVYAPSKPNLHIISIGIPAPDLKYTAKDARDFTAALTDSQNKAFGKIFADTMYTETRTTKTEILKALRRLQYRYADLQILPKDLLIVFVSGHGLSAFDGSFRLAASDYDGPFMQETSLDFEQEIIHYLQTLSCRKLFLVDACHSGNTSGTGLSGIAQRNAGLHMMVSCQPDEYSYEDDAWENGAFTSALVRGFKAFTTQSSALDQNADKQLDVSELFAFIEKEVPEMVKKKKPKTKTQQLPKLVLPEPNKPVVLFGIE